MQPTAGVDDQIWRNHHKLLAINGNAGEALALGATNTAEPHRHFSGDRPSVLIVGIKPHPMRLAACGTYEHITIISGFIWDVNSFDQWGVELGKSMANQLKSADGLDRFSPAARAFLDRLNKTHT